MSQAVPEQTSLWWTTRKDQAGSISSFVSSDITQKWCECIIPSVANVVPMSPGSDVGALEVCSCHFRALLDTPRIAPTLTKCQKLKLKSEASSRVLGWHGGKQETQGL